MFTDSENDTELEAAQKRLSDRSLEKAKPATESDDEDEPTGYNEAYMKKYLGKYMQENPEEMKKITKKMGLTKAEVIEAEENLDAEIESSSASGIVIEGTEAYKTMTKAIVSLASNQEEILKLLKSLGSGQAEIDSMLSDVGLIISKTPLLNKATKPEGDSQVEAQPEVDPVKGQPMSKAVSQPASPTTSEGDALSNEIMEKAKKLGGHSAFIQKLNKAAYEGSGNVMAQNILEKLEENGMNIAVLSPQQKSYLSNEVLTTGGSN